MPPSISSASSTASLSPPGEFVSPARCQTRTACGETLSRAGLRRPARAFSMDSLGDGLPPVQSSRPVCRPRFLRRHGAGLARISPRPTSNTAHDPRRIDPGTVQDDNMSGPYIRRPIAILCCVLDGGVLVAKEAARTYRDESFLQDYSRGSPGYLSFTAPTAEGPRRPHGRVLVFGQRAVAVHEGKAQARPALHRLWRK